jgi:hypothetical protein
MDKYLCINDSFSEKAKQLIKNFPKFGEVYTLRLSRKEPNGRTGFLLKELPNPYFFSPRWGESVEPSFDASRFIKWDPETLEMEIHEEEYETA